MTEAAADLRSKIGLLTPEEVAQMIDVTTNTLAMWRSDKKGPSFVKLGRSVFYRVDDVQRWIEASIVAAETPIELAAE